MWRSKQVYDKFPTEKQKLDETGIQNLFTEGTQLWVNGRL